jgi:predicted ATPase
MVRREVREKEDADPEAYEEALWDIIEAMREFAPEEVIVTFRPEFEPPWIGRPQVSALTLNRLGEREIVAMIDRVAGNKPLPAKVRLDIVERTDGIPLFIEEMTKAVLEAESEGDARRTVASAPALTLAVPASLHASLMARLDRLGPAKEVAQIGAVIGREFSHALLAAAASKPQAELASALDQLVQSGLLFRQGMPPHASYLFKHALVQDTAYSTLLREPRRALHARIADVLENQFPEIAESRPELLAHHCTAVGLIEKAAGLWGKAGQRSMERSALAEAVQQLTCGLEQIAVSPATPALRREQIKLQVTLVKALTPIKGWGAPETKAAAERARLLIEQAEGLGEPPDDPLLLFSVLHSLWVGTMGVGVDAHDLARQFFARAEKQGTTAPLMLGHRVLGISLGVAGSLVQAVAHFDQVLALYDPAEHRPLVTRFGADSRVNSLVMRSETAWMLGHPDVAAMDAEHGLKDAREVNHALTLMLALRDTASTHALRGSYATASAQADELVTLADEKGALPWKVTAILIRGRLSALTGKAGDAVPMLTSGIAALRSMGQTLIVPTSLSHLAMAHAEVGQFDAASRSIREAIMTAEASKVVWWEAEFHRIAGEIALKSPPSDAAKAESCFERALSVARAQQAKSWELRAAMSMARLWRDQGKQDEARELLAPVCGWFTEGFDTRDLKEAKALLSTLAA